VGFKGNHWHFLLELKVMSDNSINPSRRRFLSITTAVVGSIGAASVAIPFVQSWKPTKKALSKGKPIEVDLSRLKKGQMMILQWRGKPLWIVKRSKEMLNSLLEHNSLLLDPLSEKMQQPHYAKNRYRSIKPDYFIAVGICTHLGCSPKYLFNSLELHVKNVQSGFFCPCHGSSFDMAGRVFAGGPASLNLMIPRYQFISENKIIVGDDQQEEV